MEYGRDTLTSEIVINSLRSKELDLKMKGKASSNGEGLFVRGRPTAKKNYKGGKRGKSQNRGKSQMFDGLVKILSGVRHVPNLHRNLISIGALDESRFVSRFEDGMIKISRGSLVIMKGLKQNGLYVLQGSTITEEAAAAIPNIQDNTNLWHKRLGHIIEKGLEVLKKQGAFGRDTISKALTTACYIVNQSPSTAIDLKTPNEMWFGKPKSYYNMRVFGCLAYAHQNEGKLEPRAVKCVFLGYLEGTKGYRLWMKDSKGYKTIVSRDVVFKEDVMPCLSECIAKTSAQHEESSDQFEVELAKPINSTQIEVEQPDTCHSSDEE
ncbi:hypothetical protein UlMin_028636 [Ulmus minor]